jgi:hypothetical protein
MNEELNAHLAMLIAQLKQGAVVPFLGAGANLANRTEGVVFDPEGRQELPTGAELARYLASAYDIEQPNANDLVRVAEWISLTAGEGPLYRLLRDLFDNDYPTTPLHDLLARLPGILREGGWPPLQVLVTTNYDDLLEQAFAAADQEVDVITYMAVGKEQGQFMHFPPSGQPRLIEAGTANTYLLPQDAKGNLQRPAILKLHGAVDRAEPDRDSFVITEDDYIDYIARSDIRGNIPATVLAKLKYSNFLFLGYSLRDWNVRAILYQIWALQRAGYKSWAIQYKPDGLDQLSWQARGVQILDVPLSEYVVGLSARLGDLPSRAKLPSA